MISHKLGPSLIGIVTSSTALIYIIFQLYFDWMHGEDESMSKRHQVWWAGLHLPFHIALVLLVEGTNQFIIWWRISESIDIASHKLLDLDKVEPTSDAVVKELTKRVYYWLEKYPPPNILDAYQGVNTTLAHIKELPNSFWNSIDIPDTDPSSIQWSKDVSELYLTMVSGIFNNFGVEAPETEEKKSSDNVTGHDSHDVIDQSAMLDAISKRFRLVVSSGPEGDAYQQLEREKKDGRKAKEKDVLTTIASSSTHFSVPASSCCS